MCSKSPFGKGGFRGIYKPFKSPLTPLFKRGERFRTSIHLTTHPKSVITRKNAKAQLLHSFNHSTPNPL